ncbi:MAG: DUF2975 domain-containing protein [Clostridia bacterium]|nr:DUF2975 domain-containing protein [Clostridia bacterium]
MSKRSLFILARILIIVIALCGLCICGFIYPFLVSLNGLDKVSEITMWSQLIFYWLSSVPCFVILGLAWKVSASFKSELFTFENASRFKLSSLLLFADAVFFFVGNLIFTLIGCNPFVIIFFFLIVTALSVALALGAAGHYVAKATEIREENEAYV